MSKKLGFKIKAHMFRHTYATRLEEAGVPAKVIQTLLGHSDIRTTQQVYIDAQDEYIQSKIPQIFGAFSDLTPESEEKNVSKSMINKRFFDTFFRHRGKIKFSRLTTSGGKMYKKTRFPVKI